MLWKFENWSISARIYIYTNFIETKNGLEKNKGKKRDHDATIH